MSKLAKKVVIDPRQSTPEDEFGAPLVPWNSGSISTVLLPQSKVGTKGFTAIKLINASTGVSQFFTLIDAYANGEITLKTHDATGDVVEATIWFNSVDVIFPAANTNSGPNPLTTMADFAQMIQDSINAWINLIPALLSAFGGGVLSPITVLWVASRNVVSSKGYLIIRNNQNIPISLDFTSYTLNMGPLLGFGYITTEYAVEHLSQSSLTDYSTFDPETQSADLLIAGQWIMGGVDNGVLALNGALSAKNILASIPLASLSSLGYRERRVIGYSIIKNSVLYQRTNEKIYGPWIGDKQPSGMIEPVLFDPYFRTIFLANSGHPVNSYIPFFGSGSKFEYEFVFNEPGLSSFNESGESIDISGTVRVT